MKSNKVYKIRDMQTGLYQVSGYHIGWSKDGKLWKTMGPMKTHIKNVMKYSRVSPDQVSLWEIVEYEIVESGRYSAGSLLTSKRK